MFGFLKNKLKEWITGAKEKIEPVEAKEETIEKPAEAKEETIEKPIKSKKPKEKKLQTKKEEIKISDTNQESLANLESLSSIKTEFIEPKQTKEIEKEQEKIKELEEGITPNEAAEEKPTNIQSIDTNLESSVPAEPESIPLKKSFLSRLFGKKEKKLPETESIKIPEIIEKEKIEIKIPETIKPSPVELESLNQKTPPEITKPSPTNIQSLDSSESEPLVIKKSFFEKIKSTFTYKITPEDFDSLFEDLDMLLLENNVAMEVVENIKLKLSKKLIGKEIKKNDLEEIIKKELKSTLNEILIDPDDPINAIKLKKEKPFIMLFFGINGSGKTTSIAKLTYQLKQKGFSVVLAAADTFRAASIEQISEHAKKLNVPLIKHDYGADPAAVGFDAIKYAKSHHIDVVLIDTAGRMHTKTNLMSEMEKIVRVTNPDLKIFVAESIAGNDAIEQAKSFHKSVNIDGSILSKADVDEKGGTIISISAITHKPIFYLGTGQTYNDLKLFNKQEFIDSLGL